MALYDIIIVGGGAAGFFTAINAAENNPASKILILERGKEVLTKVRVSGGGRCNVTHAEFIPAELVKRYPRGEKELRGPFHKFMTGDTIEWFEKRGIELKTEEDGRMFPITDSSETIINCFTRECTRLNIEIQKGHSLKNFQKSGDEWNLQTSAGDFITKKLMLATGSNSKVWNLLEKMGHAIVQAVPSLFTFNIKDTRIKDLAGIAADAEVTIPGGNLQSSGPLLITHWGMSGPAILKLSAWGARELNMMNYKFSMNVNWLPGYSESEILDQLKELKFANSKQQVSKRAQFELPKRLWQSITTASLIKPETKWADLNKEQLLALAKQLTSAIYKVDGKSTFKEEFVTAGGIDLREVEFKTFESKLHKNLYFAGEILNIDAITGGFNFQNAWTGGYLAAKAMS
ncbi:NAD(P)/FAD-dependent oxidoreductase [Christiangramia sabulilitoris]|uniref:NAD(P)/FAD-dependent oxidoreductase n=1 Tax=Christiangramia sabulilitoris TaxID=2583991 RepID=A0A550I091_9FLAO|nr:NAD(P)/FAD-dependent oxidoreductase [Christiangramia sabulilitoris]TRO64391.1 NAD(P)/FAD-dependent oxidoreductase [Christiangramia sabulilitoris]